jgi:hypothetical protein
LIFSNYGKFVLWNDFLDNLIKTNIPMTRTITRTLPLLAILLVFILSSCSDSMYSGKHYGRGMYVKADRQKTETQLKKSDSQTQSDSRVEASADIAAIPDLNLKRLGSSETKPIAKKLDESIAKVFPRMQKSNTVTKVTADVTNFVRTAPKYVQTISKTPAETQDEASSTLFTILIILGVILLIAGFLTLVLDLVAGAGGWLGLIIAGLIIILLAYLIFNA